MTNLIFLEETTILLFYFFLRIRHEYNGWLKTNMTEYKINRNYSFGRDREKSILSILVELKWFADQLGLHIKGHPAESC